MDSAVGVHNVANLTNFEGVRRIFERLLHLPTFEEAEITVLSMRGAVRVLVSEFSKFVEIAVDFGGVTLQDPDSFLF